MARARFINPYTDFGFKKLFGEEASKEIAEIANYSQSELDEYEESLKVYRDLKGVLDTSFMEGVKEGRKEGLKEGELRGLKKTAVNMRNKGFLIDDIAEMTGFSVDIINEILNPGSHSLD